MIAPEKIIGSLWGFTPAEVRRVPQVESQAWEIVQGKRRYYLKHHRFQEDPASLKWELQLLCQLAALDGMLKIPYPEPTQQGDLFGTYDDTHWILFHAVEGEAVDINQWDALLASRIGRSMARFHNCTRTMDIRQRPGHHPILEDGNPHPPGAALADLIDRARRTKPTDLDEATLLDNLDEIIYDLHEVRQNLRQRLGTWRSQLVHRDFMPWNVLVDSDGEISALIDFEFTQLDHRVSDLSRVAYINSEHVGESTPYPIDWVIALSKGYMAETDLSETELTSVPDFMRLHFLIGCLAMMGQWLFDGPQWIHLKDHVRVYAGLWPKYLKLRLEADLLRQQLVDCRLPTQ